MKKTLIKKVLSYILPLISDTTPGGGRKLSIGRLPMFLMSMIMCYLYAKTGAGPDSGVLGFLGMAMAYNFGSKSKAAQGNGGEGATAAGQEPTQPSKEGLPD